MGFYEDLSRKEYYQRVLENPNENLIAQVNDSINSRYKYRPYQKSALTVFDWIVNKPDVDTLKLELQEGKLGNFPIYGFEMATGSGKTILIGSFIVYLNQKFGFKNFLVLTPPRGKSAIYDKTIRNFDLNSQDCVLSNNMEKKFNLVTGENYINKSSNYDENADFNIFVLNINKFFESNAGVKYVDKPWEESNWKNKYGSIISFREYLTLLEDLVIITDEAHHFQKYNSSGDDIESGRGNSAGDIVTYLKPSTLIEFTATMVKDQKAIFRYPVNEYISEGYGKKIRAWGINTKYADGLFSFENEVKYSDAEKIIRGIATHLIKKIALGYDKNTLNKKNKPVLLVKARDTEHADKVCEYIKKGIRSETDSIKKVYAEIIKDDEYEISSLIKEHISKEYLINEIIAIGDKTFSFHTKNETRETLELFSELERNDMEIIVQVDKATEGWNIDNVYTILILTNSRGEIKTNVKQLVGRGLRLLREKRIYDSSTDKLKKEEEILHIVCEQGNNFGNFAQEIRDEIGFNSDNFSEDRITKNISNDINPEFDTTMFNDLRLPKVEKDTYFETDNPLVLIDKLSYEELDLNSFVDEVSNQQIDEIEDQVSTQQMDEVEDRFLTAQKEKDKKVEVLNKQQDNKENRYILKRKYSSTGEEIDLQSLRKLREGQSSKIEEHPLILDEIQKSKIVKEVVKSNNLLPSHKAVYDALSNRITDLTTKNPFYFEGESKDADSYVRGFSNKLVHHISKKIDTHFKSETVIGDYISFKNIFESHPINIDKDLEISSSSNGNKVYDLLRNKKSEIPKYYITGYQKSYFTHVKFDSSQELKFAEMLDRFNDVEMWVKNKSTGQFIIKYGLGKEFSPDFLVKLKNSNVLHIIEIKGSILLGVSKDKVTILREIDSKGESFECHFYIDTNIDALYDEQPTSFEELWKNNDLYKLS